MSKRIISLLFVVIITSFVALGCAGDDGSNGATGPAGPQGPAGEPATTVPAEQCTMCHVSGDIATAHAPSANGLAVTSTGLTLTGSVIEVPVNITMGGLPVTDITTGVTDFYNVALYIAEYDATNDEWVNLLNDAGAIGTPGTDNMTGSDTIVYNGSHGTPTAWQAAQWDPTGAATGDYVASFDALATTDLTNGADYRVVVYIRDSFEGYDSDSDRDHASHVVEAQWDGAAFVASTVPATAVSGDNADCDSCHGQADGTKGLTFHGQREGVEFCSVCHNSQGIPSKPEFDLGYLAHAIHNGHTNGFAYVTEDLQPETVDYSHVGFPKYTGMTDCASCHIDANVATATGNTVDGETCFSCHGDVTTMGDAVPATHDTFTAASGCGCHDGTSAPGPNVDAFHDGTNAMTAEVSAGTGWLFEIQDITTNGTDVTVTWRANDGVADLNICNTDNASGPIFIQTAERRGFADGGGYFVNFLVSTFTGDDYTNEYTTSVSAQPNNVSVQCDNASADGYTTNAAGIATTTFAAPVTSGDVAIAIQGVPEVYPGGVPTFAIVDGVNATYDAEDIDGTAVTGDRRTIVDVASCNNCHGDLVFHGHNRVNNAQLCVQCHNPSATDRNRRAYYEDTYGMDFSTIDGKDQESFDLKVMLHDIHAGNDWFVARTDNPSYGGIYAFLGSSDTTPSGWEQEATVRWTAYYPRYPAATGDCEKCHVSGGYEMPDPTQAVGVTIDQGADLTTQADDTIMGPGQAVCSACHDSYLANGHYDIFGYEQEADKEMVLDNQ